ncbi:Cytochrome c peroxidase, mitochondrial [Choanephora cucurbitarum]|uniref:Peroxidase n=1 Tax=Choanephora cucurbitarum TaxID=101091 RepID=A0A1C7NHF6_9FUNG|nr:Cytochrome c peroxidase, mitochondrial [Choanephora cucurbitarum]
MNNLRSILTKTRITQRNTAFVSGSVAAAYRVRPTAAIQSRGYASIDTPKKGGSGSLIFLTLAAVGGAAGYYYNSAQSVTTQTIVDEKTNKKNIDYQQVYNDIAQMLDEDSEYDDGSYGPVLVRLAWHASGTYDKDTKTGGSNGATMRFKPESLHAANNGLAIARDLLEKIHAKYPEISYGDLWTLAGVCAIQELGGPTIPWRPGRQDAIEDAKACTPDGRLPDATKKQDHIRDIFYRMGFDDQEIVALTGAHALGRCHPERSGFEGPWQEAPTVFSNEYYKAISTRTWVKKELANGGWQWVDKSNPDVMMLPAEIHMYNDKEFKKYFDLYAKDQDKFYKDFAAAFKKLIELGVPFKGDEKVYEFKPTTQ